MSGGNSGMKSTFCTQACAHFSKICPAHYKFSFFLSFWLVDFLYISILPVLLSKKLNKILHNVLVCSFPKTKLPYGMKSSIATKNRRNWFLLPKLFWPTVRKNVLVNSKFFFKSSAFSLEFQKFFSITRTIADNCRFI